MLGPIAPAAGQMAALPSAFRQAAPARLVASVMTFVLEALGHPSAGLQVPAELPDGWRSLDGIRR